MTYANQCWAVERWELGIPLPGFLRRFAARYHRRMMRAMRIENRAYDLWKRRERAGAVE